MPTLDWIGKSKVVNHHLDVPYCALDRKYSFDESGQHEEDNGSENMIIHGDNLLALKSLLPQYEGRIKCIYIDPPYNTGNEGWIYNDNVNDPHIKEWLNKVVGKEGEDLSRHDKWLCMMYSRLKLLQKLLAEDGAIFISIDDNEKFNLKMICDEIFGGQYFVADIAVINNLKGRSDGKYIATAHESLLIYRKSDFLTNGVAIPDEYDKEYKLIDEIGRYRLQGLRKRGTNSRRVDRPNMWYPFYFNEKDDHISLERVSDNDIEIFPFLSSGEEGCWRWGRETAISRINELTAQLVSGRNEYDIFQKDYISTEKRIKPKSFWNGTDFSAETGTLELKKILGRGIFQTPKPTGIVEYIMEQACTENSIILDSFAGSGTTAHAVLNMNKADGGHRKFILVEMGDYADTITAERVKRVIKGYKAENDKEEVIYDEELKPSNLDSAPQMLAAAKAAKKKAKESGRYDSVSNPKIADNHLQVIGKIKANDKIAGTGGSFSYYELGEAIFDGDLLNESIGANEIRKYVYFTETKQPLTPAHEDEPYYMGTHMDIAYYFNYEKDSVTTLNRDFLHTVKTKADGYVIYADLCTLSQRELEKWHITFKKIPRDISRL